ncbi:MAG: prolyl oligopeptidase family serine peptidase [Campylobacteraceae bacterium]|nr:prolyl oligopeptidase family serine peptidase [Campylobacteraceae bacterium]
MNKIIINLKYIVIITIISLFTACTSENEGTNSVGSNFVEAKLLNEVNATTNLAYIKGSFKPDATNAFSYKSIKIKYKTINQEGNEVLASGVLVLPTPTKAYLLYLKSLGKTFSISTIVENHGTIFTNAEAPSKSILTVGSASQGTALLMSGLSGFAVVMPDYLGYGDSNDSYHPYILKKTSARVSIDMLRASVAYMTNNNIIFNGQVYISGYSEGGYVAMAMAKELQENYSSSFNVKALAAMAGPYDVKSLADKEIDENKTMVYPAFLAYLSHSYLKAYSGLSFKDSLVYENEENFHKLFNGSSTGTTINISLLNDTLQGGYNVAKADKLFKLSFINEYKSNVNNSFKVRFSENNVFDWAPRTKVNLIHCVDDEIVPFSMSQTAYDKFISNGASKSNITLSAIPTSALSTEVTFIHSKCGEKAYGVAVTWFDKIRKGEIK